MAEDDYYGTNGLLDMASSQYKMSAMAGGASAFAQLMGGFMDARALKTNAKALKVQANDIELQAKQRANYLREQFISSIGSYQFSAANRGVSVGSGSVRQNIEESAMSVGKDIQKAKTTAQMQANALRTQAKVAKIQSRAAKMHGILSSMSSLAGAVASYSMGSALGSSGTPSGSPVTNGVSVPVPSKKPF